MENLSLAPSHRSVIPPIGDAQAGQQQSSTTEPGDLSWGVVQSSEDTSRQANPLTTHGLSLRKVRTLISELSCAIRGALDGERGTAEDCLQRAEELLHEMGETATATTAPRGGLAPWQIRKVATYIGANLDRTIRNDDLAALVRLNPSHFGRAFRNSFGEPPHEYVIRRRVERAQGLMLSTSASLSDIALECGLSDQSHLTRLFRRIAGESPRAWRRARISAPCN